MRRRRAIGARKRTSRDARENPSREKSGSARLTLRERPEGGVRLGNLTPGLWAMTALAHCWGYDCESGRGAWRGRTSA